ncbi:hypothetical protein [Chitinimonas taiwanensis]|uniref:Yip1 domain-containing protein n=1 Tax=Chitinimonas taiwanensis DSM 18899 TaxID=1121279 RepID=A0A1K2HQ89_9NEIS|nr:hypothetical protein [Chitinimonas taiwanensis]SFZ78976.1 hypothetical protein SAMN02745887_03294 [Chitinimonas taiwanensis DSM 18899]
MPPIILDAIDVARFRVKALSHYAYEWWQPVLLLTALAGLPILIALLGGGVATRQLLPAVLTWVQVLLFTLFSGWWLKRYPGERPAGSLFPLVVLASCAQLSSLLLVLVPGVLQLPAFMLLLFYQFAVLVNALAKTNGVPAKHMVNGLFVFVLFVLVLCVFLSILLAMLGVEPAKLAEVLLGVPAQGTPSAAPATVPSPR